MRGGDKMTKEQLKQMLIKARKEKSLTHEEVALLTSAGISRQYYGMIENGERRPSVEIAKSIADVLDIDWTIFFEITGNHSLQTEKQAI